ncbi:hypothetical protein QUB52_25980 [Microcoleus sp. A6-C6]
MLIIKEKIFNDANTGSNLGGRAQEWQGDRQKRLKTLPLPYTLAPAPFVAARIFCPSVCQRGIFREFRRR